MTYLSDDGQIEEHGVGFTFFWIIRKADERRETSVGFAVRTSPVSRLNALLRDIRNRLITLRSQLVNSRIINFYASIFVIWGEKSSSNDVSFNLSLGHKIIWLCCLNTRSEWEAWN